MQGGDRMISESRESKGANNNKKSYDMKQKEVGMDSLLRLSNMSLESIQVNDEKGIDPQMRQINDSDNKRSEKDIYDQLFQVNKSRNKDQIHITKSNNDKSLIEQQPFLLNKSDNKNYSQINKSLDEKHHQCFCANSKNITCEICRCLLVYEPCVYGVCCNSCYTFKHHITMEKQKDMIEEYLTQKKSDQKMGMNSMDIQSFIEGFDSVTNPIKQQVITQSSDDLKKGNQNNNGVKTGHKTNIEDKFPKSPQKIKKIRKVSDSIQSKDKKDKSRSRKKIFKKESQKQDEGNKPYPIISPQPIQVQENTQKISDQSSPSKKGKMKGLGVTLNSSVHSPQVSPQLPPQLSPVKQQKPKRAPVAPEKYRCNCNLMECNNLYCKCFRMGKGCSQDCGCADCQNGYENIKNSGPKVYLENSGSGINRSMEFDPFVPPITMSQERSIQSSNNSVSVNNSRKIRTSEKRSCECEKGSKCIQKTCECFSNRQGCGVQCKCQLNECRNRKT